MEFHMKIKSLKKIFILYFIFSCNGISTPIQAIENVSSLAKEIGITGSVMSAAYLSLWYIDTISSVYIHELGHKIAFKILCNAPSKISMTLNPWKVAMGNGTYVTTSEKKVSNKGWRYAGVCAAGPIAGLLYEAALLKLTQFLPQSNAKNYYIKDLARGIVIVSMLSQVYSLFPRAPFFEYPASDGYQILNAFDLIEQYEFGLKSLK